MKALLNNRSMAILAFVALLGICGVSAVYPASNPTMEGNYDAAMVGNIAWMIVASSLVLLMTPGLAFFYGGMVSKRNIISTMLQSFICLGVISVLWYVVGFSLAFGDDIGGVL
jgi:ammonium transporter, Amt family